MPIDTILESTMYDGLVRPWLYTDGCAGDHERCGIHIAVNAYDNADRRSALPDGRKCMVALDSNDVSLVSGTAGWSRSATQFRQDLRITLIA